MTVTAPVHASLAPLDGRAALRFGIALILLWFGYMKFLPYEAEGVAGIAQDYCSAGCIRWSG